MKENLRRPASPRKDHPIPHPSGVDDPVRSCFCKKISLEAFSVASKEDSSKKSEDYSIQDMRVTTPSKYFGSKKAQNILIFGGISTWLGSMWRFPYLCQQNGGGTFILLYVFLLLLLGIPLVYVELVIGQWLRLENLQVWKKLVPFLGGVGYASILASFLMSLYNSALVSWSLFYLGSSFNHPLPWNHCPLLLESRTTCCGDNSTSSHLSCLRTVPHQYFWYHTMLEISGPVEEGVKVLVLKLSLCLIAAWTFLCLAMVVKMKILVPMLISSILCIVIILCFFIRGLFLEGAVTSLRRLVTTKLSTLSVNMWQQAGNHVLYSLGLGLGTIITFSSYVAGDDNYVKVASLVALFNLVTSVLTTSTIFLVLGYWATTSGTPCVEKNVSNLLQLISRGMLPQEARPPENIALKPPQDYLDWINSLPLYLQEAMTHLSLPCSILVQKAQFMESPGLAFVAYSQAILLFPSSSFWAIVFFMAVVVLGLSTMFALLEGIVLPLQNSITSFMNYPRLLPVITCLVGFMSSLIFTSRSGSNVMFLFDNHLIPIILAIIIVFQNLALLWIYGARRVKEEMFSQLGCLLWTPFAFLWSYLTLPILLFLVSTCSMNLYDKKVPHYITWNSTVSQEVKEPYMKTMLGWVTFLSVLILLPIPIYPLQQWWYSEDPVTPDILNKLQVSKKRHVGPSSWPMNPPRRPTNGNQVEGRDVSPEVSLNLIKSPRVVPITSRATATMLPVRDETHSRFSLSRLASLFTMSSSSFRPSRQVNETSTEVGVTKHEEAPKKKSLPDPTQ